MNRISHVLRVVGVGLLVMALAGCLGATKPGAISGQDVVADGGPGADTGVGSDTGPSGDTGTATDTGSGADTLTPLDTTADTVMDAKTLSDGGIGGDTAVDAVDTGPAIDTSPVSDIIPDPDTTPPTDTAVAPCEAVYQGDFTIVNGADVDTLAAYCELTGSLIVNAPGLTSVVLPDLTKVGGFLQVDDTDDLSTFSLPALTVVEYKMTLDRNTALTVMETPKLEVVGMLSVRDNPLLTSFSFQGLALVGGGGLSVNNNANLATFSFPSLTTVGKIFGPLSVANNSVLAAMSFPVLNEAGGSFAITQNPQLALCLVEALVEQLLTGNGIKSGTQITGNNEACTCKKNNGVLEATCP
jgi:hypothetical protein